MQGSRGPVGRVRGAHVKCLKSFGGYFWRLWYWYSGVCKWKEGRRFDFMFCCLSRDKTGMVVYNLLFSEQDGVMPPLLPCRIIPPFYIANDFVDA